MKQDEKEFITHAINGTNIIPFGGNCPVQIVFRSALPSKVTWLDRADTGRDPFNQNSNRSDREKRTTSKGGPVFSKLFRLDRTDPLSFGPKFPEILVEWIAPTGLYR